MSDLPHPKTDVATPADVVKEREIIRLWHRLRLLEREGRSVTVVVQQIEKALAERERHAA
jgi:hypothetical protein